jgi:hypothetical protein
LAIAAAATQAPKVMMPTEISSETTLSMVGCSSRLCRPPSGKMAQPGERNVYLGHHLRLGGDYHRIRGFIRMQRARDSLAPRHIATTAVACNKTRLGAKAAREGLAIRRTRRNGLSAGAGSSRTDRAASRAVCAESSPFYVGGLVELSSSPFWKVHNNA